MMKRKRRGSILITLGILMILGALGLTGYNIWDGMRAKKASDQVAQQLIKEIGDSIQLETVAPYADPEAELPARFIDGYEYIGILEIPSLGLSLPVMKEWDYTRLKIAPCRYTGSYYSDDLVICAHNYATHLGGLLQIDIGVDVYFTSVEGVTIHYIVTNRETVEPTAVEKIIKNTKNSEESQQEWDLTLFTCNLGGKTRCVVRCSRAEAGQTEEEPGAMPDGGK